MGWKDWPYWVKGGIIVAAICFAIIIVFLLTSSLQIFNPLQTIINGTFIIITYPSAVIASLFGSRCYGAPQIDCAMTAVLNNPAWWLFSIIVFFLIGALIGWIVGKIKNKRSSN